MTSPTPTPPCLGEREAVARTGERQAILWLVRVGRLTRSDSATMTDAIIAEHIEPLRTENETLLAERDAAIARAEEAKDSVVELGEYIIDLEHLSYIREDLTWRDEATRLRAKLAQAEGWQPIETAPRNKAIQVYVPNLDYYGNEGVYAGMLVDMGTGPRWMTFGWAIGRDLGTEALPTHWRPLPAPPALPLTKEAAR